MHSARELLFENDFIDLSTHSNVKCQMNSLLMHNLWVVVFLRSPSSSFLLLLLLLLFSFISICDCFSLSIHVSAYFFPRSSFLHWIPKLFFLMVTHIHFSATQNVKLFLYYLFEVIDIVPSLSYACEAQTRIHLTQWRAITHFASVLLLFHSCDLWNGWFCKRIVIIYSIGWIRFAFQIGIHWFLLQFSVLITVRCGVSMCW